MITLKKIAFVILMVQYTNIISAQSKADTIAIQNILQDETNFWNKGDAKGYSQNFAVDGTFTNILGLYFTGHENFMIRHEEIFKGVFKGTVLTKKLVSLKFVHPDVAVVETLSFINGFSVDGPPKGANLDEKGRLRTRLLQVIVRDGSGWKIVAYHNVDLKPGIPAPEPD